VGLEDPRAHPERVEDPAGALREIDRVGEVAPREADLREHDARARRGRTRAVSDALISLISALAPLPASRDTRAASR
jgi:hypothetical protein